MEHPPVPSLVLSCARKVTNKNRTETLIVHCKTRKIGSLSPRGLERKTDGQRKSQPKSPQVLREHTRKQKGRRARGRVGAFGRHVPKQVVSEPMLRAPALSGDAKGRGAEVWLTTGFSTRV